MDFTGFLNRHCHPILLIFLRVSLESIAVDAGVFLGEEKYVLSRFLDAFTLLSNHCHRFHFLSGFSYSFGCVFL
jgi:hypothetical protein